MSERGRPRKIPLRELVTRKKKGYTQSQLAERYGVKQHSISMALAQAKEKGLWNGEEGLNPKEEHSYDNYVESQKEYEGKDMVGRLLTREEWNSLWENPSMTIREKDMVKSPEHTSLIPKKKSPEPLPRCPKCGRNLVPMEKITFEGDSEPSRKLLNAGYNWFCVYCYCAYIRDEEERDYSRLEKNQCPKCGRKVQYLPTRGFKVVIPYCESCDLLFLTEEIQEKLGMKR